MRGRVLPALLVATCLSAMLTSLVWSYYLLPGQVAVHFNAAGQPDRWASRGSHLALMGLTGIALPLLLLLVFWGVRYLPLSVVNIPHRDYWLAPQRRVQTIEHIFQLGLWFTCLEGLFFLVLHWLVVAANRQLPVQLSWLAWLVLATYLMLLVGWIVWFWRMFRLPPQVIGEALSSGAQTK